ncbi:MAG TPA: hypothetical protein VL088_00870 [Pedobacter sp.]|nr:hypothetical protein [Pedobacter sp.]
MIKKNIPFDFIFDHLIKSQIEVKPMFGFFAVYSYGKIILVLRQRADKQALNGIWVAVDPQHLSSIKTDYPSLIDLPIVEGSRLKKSTWLMINEFANDFEEIAIKLCNLIESNDLRIGHRVKTLNV